MKQCSATSAGPTVLRDDAASEGGHQDPPIHLSGIWITLCYDDLLSVYRAVRATSIAEDFTDPESLTAVDLTVASVGVTLSVAADAGRENVWRNTTTRSRTAALFSWDRYRLSPGSSCVLTPSSLPSNTLHSFHVFGAAQLSWSGEGPMEPSIAAGRRRAINLFWLPAFAPTTPILFLTLCFRRQRSHRWPGVLPSFPTPRILMALLSLHRRRRSHRDRPGACAPVSKCA